MLIKELKPVLSSSIVISGQFHKTEKQLSKNLGLRSFLSEKFTLIPYHKILSLALRYFMKLAPGSFGTLYPANQYLILSTSMQILPCLSISGVSKHHGDLVLLVKCHPLIRNQCYRAS